LSTVQKTQLVNNTTWNNNTTQLGTTWNNLEQQHNNNNNNTTTVCNLLQISPLKLCFEKLRFFENVFSECRKSYL
jgi:hypothetical protein